jgi:Cu/Zn superoxide dismutase
MQYGWRKGSESPKLKATCEVGPNGKPCHGASEEKNTVSGMVTFEDTGEKCNIVYKITGLAPGSHGFHIHEKSDFSNGCVSAGPHYNPHKVSHGGPGTIIYHIPLFYSYTQR